MSDHSLAPAIAELERAFDFFAPRFKRDMPRPIIVIQTNGRSAHTLGWFCPHIWGDGEPKGDPIHEITLCAEHLKRPTPDVLETLIHEMVHLANNLDGISDCSKTQYHNKRFRDPAAAPTPASPLPTSAPPAISAGAPSKPTPTINPPRHTKKGGWAV